MRKEKYIGLLVAVFVTMMMFSAIPAAGQYAYAKFSAGTLTFYYDNNKTHNTYSLGVTTNQGMEGCEWLPIASEIKKIVFDQSFANYRPTSCAYWFYNCKNLTEIVDMDKYLNTEQVTDMYFMFAFCGLSNIDVSQFNTENVTNMGCMFYGCNNISSLDLSSLNTKKLTEMGGMFRNCENLKYVNLENFNTENVVNMAVLFYECPSITHIDLSSFNTKNAQTMGAMFTRCSNLVSVNLSSFNTENVTSMPSFEGCSNLKSIDLKNFNTKKARYMSAMFKDCSSLTVLDLSSFDTRNVESMHEMFAGCDNLQTIYVGNGWNTASVSSNTSKIFQDCYKLYGGEGTSLPFWDQGTKYAKIDGGIISPGLLTRAGSPAFNAPYSVFDENTGCLTIYYKDEKPEITYGIRNKKSANVKKVVFDKSFANYRPTSCNAWFNGYENLVEIVDMEKYLNTENVVDV